MSIAVLIAVHDGIVLAADSASTLTATTPAGVGIVNVYDNANKIFNLYKGLPMGCITFGSGSIGNASVATLMKDLRVLLTKKQLGFDPENYTIEQVASILAQFLDTECQKLTDPLIVQAVSMGYLIGGYSSGETLAESWSVEVQNGKASDPKKLRNKEECKRLVNTSFQPTVSAA
jgi:20S proteasome alpha/beta subunit